MIVELWKGTTSKVRVETILTLDRFNLAGEDIVAHCLGLESPDGTEDLLPYSTLYKLGQRAVGVRKTTARRLLYAAQVQKQIQDLRASGQEAQSARADPDADGAEPPQVRVDAWRQLPVAVQVARLGNKVRVLAR